MGIDRFDPEGPAIVPVPTDKSACKDCHAVLPASSFYRGRRLCRDCYNKIAVERRAAKGLNQQLLDGWKR